MVKRSELFTKYGSPVKGLACALSVHHCATLEELESRKFTANPLERLIESDIYHARGNGTKRNPGKLAQYLFGVKPGQDQRQERVLLDLGAGI